MSKAQQGAVGPTGSSGVPRPIAVPGKGPFSISRLPSHYCSPPRPLCSRPVCQEEGERQEGAGGGRGLGEPDFASVSEGSCPRSIPLKMQNRGQTGLPPDALSAVLCLPLLGSASNNRGHREGQQP